jgi:hypothetical protein
MALGHYPRRTKSGRFRKGRYSRRTSGHGKSAKFHHGRHSKARWRVECGPKRKRRTITWHKKKSAAKAKRIALSHAGKLKCRVVKV